MEQIIKYELIITKKESKIISFFKALKKLIFGEKNVTEKIN